MLVTEQLLPIQGQLLTAHICVKMRPADPVLRFQCQKIMVFYLNSSVLPAFVVFAILWLIKDPIGFPKTYRKTYIML